MPNWSVKATAASVDNVANNGNIIVTFAATNSVTLEVVTEQSPSANWSVAQAQAYAENMVNRLVLRDQFRAKSAAALPGIQAYIATNPTLATG